MKISKITIERYKSIRKLEVDFQDLMILVGENNSGKTNILTALELFFSSSTRGVDDEYFYNKNKDKCIEIVITFDRLTDDEKKSKLKKYIINDTLTIKKVCSWDPNDEKFKARFYGLTHEPKEDYLKESKIKELSKQSGGLKKIVQDKGLPTYFHASSGNVTQKSYEEGLRRYISENYNDIEWDEPRYDENNPLGYQQVLKDNLPEFLYVPAVRDITEESKITTTTLFGKLINSILTKITEENEQIKDIEIHIKEIKRRLDKPEKGDDDHRLEEIKAFEKYLTDMLQETMPTVSSVDLEIKPPGVKEIFQMGTKIRIDDGIPTYVESKGHGLQRSMIFTLFRAYAKYLRKHKGDAEEKIKKERKPMIFAIEEPELYLHPQSQRVMFDVLKNISQEDQVIFCTHSTFFVDMGMYKSISIVKKGNLEKGSEIKQYIDDIFTDHVEKNEFKLLNEFDPERNELFFAKKVILVEGDKEKVVFPLVARKMGIYNPEFTIVECAGKSNIPFFIKVLNAFEISYVVVHDVDPQKDTSKLNEVIKKCVDSSIGTIIPIDPNFEVITIPEKSPFTAFKHFYDKTEDQIPTKLKNITKSIFNQI